MENTIVKIIKNGILNENPIFRMVMGMCPTLAVSSSVENCIGMGVATTFVMVGSNMFVSLLRNFISEKLRIPSYVVIVSAFVMIVQLVLKAFMPALDKALGLFIPLIVVNCIILARAEAFANKNSVGYSILDGLSMGAGFTLALILLGSIREILGAGTWFGMSVLGGRYDPALIMALAPGGFITLGLLMGLMNFISEKAKVGN